MNLECRELKLSDGMLEDVDGITFHTDHKNKGKVLDAKFIVIHYTAGPTMKSAIRTLTNPKRMASAHFIIDKDGSIAQLVETNRVAWHAGKSNIMLEPGGETFKGLNEYSIGIEFVNAGRLLRSRSREVAGGTIDGYIPAYRSWWGKQIPLDDVFIDDDYFVPGKYANQKAHRIGVPFERYTEEQIESGLSVCQAIIDYLPIKTILGHSEIAIPEGRKLDPGPAFPMDNFRSLLQGRV